MNKTGYKLTKEDIKNLNTYKLHLTRAQQGYTLGLQTYQINILESIYNKLGHNLHSRSCSGCVLGMLKTLSYVYDEQVNKNKNKKDNKDGE